MQKFKFKWMFIATTVAILTSCATYHRSFRDVKLEDVYVDIGAPRHWTLDEAHYLLASMQNRMTQLSIQKPTLDPNAFNSTKIESVQTIADIAVKYDQIAGFQNRVGLANYENQKADRGRLVSKSKQLESSIATHREEMMKKSLEKAEADKNAAIKKLDLDYKTELKNKATEKLNAIVLDEEGNEIDVSKLTDEEQGRVKDLKKEIKDLDYEISDLKLNYDKFSEESIKLKSQYDTEKAQHDLLVSDLTATNDAIGDLSATLTSVSVPTDISSTNSTLANTLSSTVEKVLNDETPNTDPKLHTSDLLANYVNAENELLARQLTLIKNDIGQGKNLIFLEMPHAIDSVEGTSSQRKVWIKWQISEYCTGDPLSRLRNDIKLLKAAGIDENLPTTNLSKLDSVTSEYTSLFKEELNYKSTLKYIESVKGPTESNKLATQNQFSSERLAKAKSALREIQNDQASFIKAACKEPIKRKLSDSDKTKQENSAFPQAWDLIPRADKFNIANQSLVDNQFNLTGIFTLLTGLGGEASFKRRRELFEQIASQQTFASAFGQGKSEFGWILNPKLGTNIVSQGANSTYASIIAPSNATVLKLEASHCVLSDDWVIGKQRPKSTCSEKSVVHSIIVNKPKEFWIDEIDYGLVKAGETATIIVRGDGFSANQLTVLADGIELRKFHPPGSPQVSGNPTPLNGNGIAGSFEVMNQSEVVIKLKMPQLYEGTPEITLVTPNKSLTINYIPAQLGAMSKYGKMVHFRDTPMFQKHPLINKVSISKLENKKDKLSLLIEGQGFYPRTQVVVNGFTYRAATNKSQGYFFEWLSPSLIKLEAKKAKEFSLVANNSLAGKILTTSYTQKTPTTIDKKLTIDRVNIISASPEGAEIKMHVLAHGNNFDKDHLKIEVFRGLATVKAVDIASNQLAYLEINTKEDRLPLKFSQAGVSSVKLITVPKVPQIQKVTRTGTNETYGLTTGGYGITIIGQNFSNVVSVKVSNKEATIIAKSSTSLEIAPPLGVVSGKSPIVLTTNATINDSVVSNALDLSNSSLMFEFKEPPKPAQQDNNSKKKGT